MKMQASQTDAISVLFNMQQRYQPAISRKDRFADRTQPIKRSEFKAARNERQQQIALNIGSVYSSSGSGSKS